MITANELATLAQRAKQLGAIVRYNTETISVVGLVGIGPNPMPLIQGAEALRKAMAMYHAG
jgi:predicted aconitase with swiveling domain